MYQIFSPINMQFLEISVNQKSVCMFYNLSVIILAWYPWQAKQIIQISNEKKREHFKTGLALKNKNAQHEIKNRMGASIVTN